MANTHREKLDTDQVEPTNTEIPPSKKYKASLSPYENYDDANIHSIEVDAPKWISIREAVTITIKARDCHLEASPITVQVQQKNRRCYNGTSTKQPRWHLYSIVCR